MFSKKMINSLGSSSMIRSMFEEGEKLRKIHGASNVYDFSLGNPDPEPPKQVSDALVKCSTNNTPGSHRYMNNAGYVSVRQKIADKISQESGLNISCEHVIMTCGAAGGLNISLKSLIDPGDEVIVFAPFFMEYLSYIDNFNGKAIIINSNAETFEPDFNLLRSRITKNTKALIINSPNNPTGVVYSSETLTQINQILEEKGKEFNSVIYVLSDEPYSKIVYDGIEVPNIFKYIKNSIIINSFSKSHSLPGERIGYVAISPLIKDVSMLFDIMVCSNRILGFVNAPAIFQQVVSETLNNNVDSSIYREKRDIFYDGLTSIGYECFKPQGAFYLFPKSLIADDLSFTKSALKYNLLFVPGSGFGFPGYFRLAYCVSKQMIEDSLPSFKKLFEEYR